MPAGQACARVGQEEEEEEEGGREEHVRGLVWRGSQGVGCQEV